MLYVLLDWFVLLTNAFSWSVNELLKAKEDLTNERDDLLSDITHMREQLSAAAAVQKKAEEDREIVEAKIAEVCIIISGMVATILV